MDVYLIWLLSVSAGSGSTSGGPAYFSDDSGGDDGMREIQQEILRADIERHIYENYNTHPPLTFPDDDMDDDDDDDDDEEEVIVEPRGRGRGGGRRGRGGGAGGKVKRRRRTQTPLQRKAANMRERKRMCHLNFAFTALKDRLPNVRNRKKLSRIQTLRAAIFYIGLLSECLKSS